MESYCKVCAEGIDEEPHNMKVELKVDVAQTTMKYGEECMDLVLELLPTVETEEGHTMNNDL